jgi:hypothetical protein
MAPESVGSGHCSSPRERPDATIPPSEYAGFEGKFRRHSTRIFECVGAVLRLAGDVSLASCASSPRDRWTYEVDTGGYE